MAEELNDGRFQTDLVPGGLIAAMYAGCPLRGGLRTRVRRGGSILLHSEVLPMELWTGRNGWYQHCLSEAETWFRAETALHEALAPKWTERCTCMTSRPLCYSAW